MDEEQPTEVETPPFEETEPSVETEPVEEEVAPGTETATPVEESPEEVDPTAAPGEESEAQALTPGDLNTGPESAVGEEEPQKPLMFETAFLVYLDGNRHWTASTEMLGVPVIVAREADLNDFFMAATTIQKDITVREGAQRVLVGFAQQAQQAMVAQRNAQVDAEVARQLGGAQPGGVMDLSKLRAPGQ